jgi:hypothetical protein
MSQEFLDRLPSMVRIEPGHRLAEIDAEVRQTLIDLFGEDTAEAVAFAAREGAVLWTDDLAVAEIARSELGVRRIWSQRL